MRYSRSIPASLSACLLLAVAPAGADEPETPTPAAFAELTPGESSRSDVIAVLGEPSWEFNLYLDSEAIVPVQLPRTTARYGPDGELRVLLRVLEYPGDRRQELYAAVLKDDILFSTFEPVPEEERTAEAVRERYGEPDEVLLNRVAHGRLFRSVEVTAYDRLGLAFVDDGGDGFSARVRHADSTTTRWEGVVIRRVDPEEAGRRPQGATDPTADDLSDAFDELDDLESCDDGEDCAR